MAIKFLPSKNNKLKTFSGIDKSLQDLLSEEASFDYTATEGSFIVNHE